MEDKKIILFPVPLEELKALISEAVSSAMKGQEVGDDLPAFMTKKQVAEFFGVSVSTVNNLVKQKILVKETVNSVVRFRRENVLNVFENYQRYGRQD